MRSEEGKALTLRLRSGPMAPKILFEDETLLAVDKPSGMVVDRNNTGVIDTVEGWAAKKVLRVPRAGIVHRLDKETSGVLLIAKTPEAFKELQRQFKSREVEKTYIALVHGAVAPHEGTIRAPLGMLHWNRVRFGVLPGGREAETRYKVISVFGSQVSDIGLSGNRVTGQLTDRKLKPGTRQPEFSLVEFYPKTGRTHQIRVHAKSIGHPVVGDTFYAGRKTSRNDRKWCTRLFLHASKISFKHPVTGKRLVVEAPLPSDLPIH